jgi:hypothetical protein
MTSRIQAQRFFSTTQRPANGSRPSGEIWLNFPDLKLGMIDPTQTAIDLLPVRVYSPAATYGPGDYARVAGVLQRAKITIPPHAFMQSEWDPVNAQSVNDLRYTTQTQNDARYYTQTQSNALFTTQAQNDARYWTQAQADGRYLKLTGGTLTGIIDVPLPGIGFGGGHHFGFGWDGTNTNYYVDSTFIGAIANQAWVNGRLGNYLPIAGGTITGALAVNGYTTLNNATINGTTTTGTMVASGAVYAGNRTALYHDGTRAYWWLDGSNTWQMQWTAGVLYYLNNVGTQLWRCDSAGSTYNAGNASIGNTLTANGTIYGNVGRIISQGAHNPSLCCYSTGTATAGGIWEESGTVYLGGMNGDGTPSATFGGFSSTIVFFASRTDFAAYYAGGTRNYQFQNNYLFRFTEGDGWLHYQAPAGYLMEIAPDGTFFVDVGQAFKPGGGSWAALSDPRFKCDEQPYACGLGKILQLKPISFRYDTDKVRHGVAGATYYGFNAEDVQQIMPEMVSTGTVRAADEDGTMMHALTLDLSALPLALVNAIQELATRLTRLENAHNATV